MTLEIFTSKYSRFSASPQLINWCMGVWKHLLQLCNFRRSRYFVGARCVSVHCPLEPGGAHSSAFLVSCQKKLGAGVGRRVCRQQRQAGVLIVRQPGGFTLGVSLSRATPWPCQGRARRSTFCTAAACKMRVTRAHLNPTVTTLGVKLQEFQIGHLLWI